MDIGILYAGLSAVTRTELITPSEAAARNITSAPVSIDKVFEYTHKQGGSNFQDFLQPPPSEDGELITPSEAEARNITSEPISVDKVFEYTYKPVRPNSRLHLQQPPSEDDELEIEKSLPPEMKQVREYELPQIGIKDKVTMEDTSDDTSNEWININVETITRQVIKIRIRKSYTIAQVKEAIERQNENLPAARQMLYFDTKHLSDEVTVESIGIKDGDTLHLSMDLRGGGPGDVPIVLDDGFLDPSYNYDFTNESDDGKVYKRGGEVYSRPYGWYRYAMKVLDKYEDNTWLGKGGTRTASTAGEWPVSYHGTSREGAEGIAKEGYDIKRGKRFMYGRGIYSSPNLSYVERYYATEFRNGGREYKIVFQNRVNPDKLRKEFRDEYWIVRDDSDIRPYGILVKETPISVERAETSNNQRNICKTS